MVKMAETRNQLESTVELQHEHHPSRRWLKLGLLVFVAVLVLGAAMVSSARSDAKDARRDSLAIGKELGGNRAPVDFQFTGQGWILGGAGKTLVVSGVSIRVDEHTQIIGALHPGDAVILSGRILPSKTWLADRIEPGQIQESIFTYNGVLESISAEVWQIGGMQLVVNEATQLVDSMAVNDLVLVTFTSKADGQLLALKIEPFDQPWVEPTPIPTVTPTPTPIATVGATEKEPPKTKPAEPSSNVKKPKSQGRVTICHNPNKKGGHTMSIDRSSLAGHLGHGDRLGPCR